ncbi:amino acid-binding protein [Microlunatus endophyticus]|uniref:Amino acid-binding protein n=2 Tax=Microlunatus endophyticus TaxID=1716077 RepID=A0A917S3J0_9ACTN|nr:amino acid-binding protein [Microlunatus endophyticus]
MFLMRVSLPDVPGSLGAVATAMGSVGADILAVEIVEKHEGAAIDDFVVGLPPDGLPDALISVCQGLGGVTVEWISRYPEGGGLQSDLETLERMTTDPEHAAETLVSSAPAVFRSQWAVLVSVLADGRAVATYSTPMAPDLDTDHLKELAPFDETHRLDLPGDWLPGYGDSVGVVSPLGEGQAIVIGRLGGPTYLDSEVARLRHLARLA